ncbi:MAG TPA: DUF308 domain-containing protein [Acidimicrobiales bacterium]
MSGTTQDLREAAKSWWVFILAGIAWFVFAFVLLSFTIHTVWAVAVFAGVGFLMGGVIELFVASQVNEWQWLHVVFGVIAIAAGIMAFAWPGQTFRTLAVVLAWYLLFAGIFDIIGGFMSKGDNDHWWLSLLLGIAQVLVGFWAVGYPGRSAALLVVWLAAAAIARGIGSFALGFGLHGMRKDGGTPAIA